MISIAHYKNESLAAGTHVFKPEAGATYFVYVSARNGGPTSVLLKLDPDDANGVAPDFFTSGEAFAARIDIPFPTVLEVILAGIESVTFIKAADL